MLFITAALIVSLIFDIASGIDSANPSFMLLLGLPTVYGTLLVLGIPRVCIGIRSARDAARLAAEPRLSTDDERRPLQPSSGSTSRAERRVRPAVAAPVVAAPINYSRPEPTILLPQQQPPQQPQQQQQLSPRWGADDPPPVEYALK